MPTDAHSERSETSTSSVSSTSSSVSSTRSTASRPFSASRNPTGQKITGPHLHLYREGHGDQWATDPEPHGFDNLDDLGATVLAFLDLIHVDRVSRQVSVEVELDG